MQAEGQAPGVAQGLGNKGIKRISGAREIKMNLQNVVEVEELTKVFGTKKAVDGVSFTIREGEIFGLVGPNGAGKTTAVRMLTTLLPPSGGTARIFGHDIRREAAQVRKFLGYVPQALSADGDLTGFENLLIFAKLLGMSRREQKTRIAEILEQMELTEAAHKLVKYYSGGMVRRLEIGQAMLTRPRLLFLDEPTVGLDPVARGRVWELLNSFRSAYPLTVLMTTHYMEEADLMCSRVAIMNHGRLAALGNPAELKAAAGNPGATLEDAFRFYTGGACEKEGDFRELQRTRRLARRLG